MKSAKSPAVSVEVSPSQKKLKQARLPFKLLSDVPAKPESPPSRKRKLSAPQNVVAPKVGKLSKENELKEDPVVISDDDSQDALQTELPEKQMNPFVKLVDMARKKKQQKSKTPKKKRNSKSKTNKSINKSVDLSADEDTDRHLENDVEMDVDEVEIISTNERKETEKKVEKLDKQNSDKVSPKTSPKAIKDSNDNKVVPKSQSKDTETIVSILLDDSNRSEVTSKQETETEKSDLTEPIKDPAEEILPVTPKRTRSKTQNINKEEKSLNDSITSSKLDNSVTSDPVTPKQNRKGDESNSSLTPKQLQKKLESAKKKELREKERQEREQKRLLEKEERDRLKREKEHQKKKEREEKEEAKKKEREEKEEAKKKEREEKEKLKELEKKQKEEKEEQKRKEKEEKEEARKKEKEAREEERRKKQEAQEQEKQEQELKKKKAAEAFANFFVPKQKVDRETSDNPMSKNEMLSSFTIKADMRLAPTIRSNLTDHRRQRLEELMETQEVSDLYVKLLRDGKSKPETMGKTWPLSEKDDDVMIVEDELPALDGIGEVLTCESVVREKLRPKLFSFHENRRPPYWGTWRKKSPHVTPRRPFGQDQKQLDYTVDSDDDWEEEAEGESLDGSAAGSDAEPEDDYEVDNEVFVPHGYLSDEEATMDDDGEDIQSLSPEAQKARLKHLEDEFETELKKPTEKLKPRLYGPIWETADNSKPEKCVDALWNYFGKLTMMMNDVTTLLQPAPEPEETEKKKTRKKKAVERDESSPKSDKKKQKEAKKAKIEVKKSTTEVKKNQRGINTFLKKLSTQ